MSTDTLTPTAPAPDPTVDSLQQFLDGIAKTPLLTRRRGGRTGEAHRARRPPRQGPHDASQPAAGRLDRQALPQPGPAVPGSHPGGHHRPGARGREVRLSQGLQVLHLRHLVDSPGDLARDRGQGPDDPDPDPHRQHPQEARRRPAQAGGPGRPGDHHRGDRRHGRSRSGRGGRDHARRPAARIARQAGGRRLGRCPVRGSDPGRELGLAVRRGCRSRCATSV